MENLGVNISSFYKGKRVFVTGHTGFKGAWLITWLHNLGAEVKGYSLPPESDKDLYNVIAPRVPHVNVFADILDREQLAREIRSFSPDIIIHMAAQALVRKSYRIPAETFGVNAVGTANLLEAIRDMPGKTSVLLVTTDKVYENRELDYYYKEDDRLGGYDPYSASKAATELVIDSFRNSFFGINEIEKHGKVLISARAGNVIGGGDWSEDRLVPDIIRALKADEEIIVRNPLSVRPWQHVLEPLSGYLLAAMKGYGQPSVYSGAYNFGPQQGDHLLVKELVQCAIECWGNGRWKEQTDSNQPHEAGLLKLDIQKAKRVLDWQPRLNSREAVEWTVAWYRQEPEKAADYIFYQIDNYSRL